MGFALPIITIWALRFPFIYFFLAFTGAGLLFFSLTKKIADKHLIGICFGILVIDTGLLLLSLIGYSIPFLYFPVTIE
jgi:hypothetical protein